MEAVNFRRVRIALLSVTSSLILVAPHFLYPCGPFAYQPVFITPKQPEDVSAYVSGRLGVPLRTYRPEYAYIAYRYLSGKPLTAAEQKLVTVPPPGISGWFGTETGEQAQPWLAARAAIAGLPPSPKFEAFKGVGDFQNILNCGPDAFKTAAKTLQDRAARYGAGSAEIKEWVAGQDRVFVQCSGGSPATFAKPAEPISPLPAEVDPSSPAWLKKDRAYQIAAANFYAGNFDESKARFLTIAADSNSPWQPWGAFLAGRSLVRKATLKPERADEAYDPKTLAEAETQLKQVLADPKLQPVHAAAKQILGFVEFRLHPEQREGELAEALAKPHAEAGFQQDLKDYLLLIRDDDDAVDDMGRWLSAFRMASVADPDAERSKESSPSKVSPYDEWKSKRTLPWLVLAMSVGRSADENKELIAAAQKVPESSPAYSLVVYNEARMLPTALARKLIDDFLAQHGRELALSTRNLFLRARLEVAGSFDEFLSFAQRQPAATGADGYGDEFQELCRAADKNVNCQRPYLDTEAAAVLDLVPVSDWLKASTDKRISPSLRKDLAATAWCRAVLVQDWTAAEQAARTTKELIPETAKYLDTFLEAKTDEERKFAAAFAMLHWPGIRPSLTDETFRFAAFNEMNDLRMNWWCVVAEPSPANRGETQSTITRTSAELLAENLLTKAEAKQALTERVAMNDARNAPVYLEPIVVAWAKRHSDDPRMPEALHLAVRAGHLSCSSDGAAKYSEQAFNLLHKNYPNSEWAKKTKYWYK